jgi:PhzF family phenazine biosynthesis protein
MGLTIYHVDAFTGKAFQGNPAAVCILPAARGERWMKNIALEMNLSETAFLVARKDAYNLRWFTPTMEVDLCGHATLASAHVLWEAGYLKTGQQARFHTRSGLLAADRKCDWIEMDFPAEPETATTAPAELSTALGAPLMYVGKNRFDYLAEVDSELTLRNLKPDFGLLGTVAMRGVIVTSRSASRGYDFVSRFFGPGCGINEDPVTGSAHCCLGPFWANRLAKNELIAFQASARGGIVRVRLAGNRVILGGQAITVLRGEIL